MSTKPVIKEFTRSVVIQNADILKLPTVGIGLIPKTAHCYHVPIQVVYEFKFAGGAYTNVNTTYAELNLWTVPNIFQSSTGLLNNSALNLTDMTQFFTNAGNGVAFTTGPFSSIVGAADMSGVVAARHQWDEEELVNYLDQDISVMALNGGAGNFTGGDSSNELAVICRYYEIPSLLF